MKTSWPTYPYPARTSRPLVAGTCSQQAKEEVHGIDATAGQASHHRAVDPDELEIVPGVLLDESHRPLGSQRVDSPLDEPGDAVMVVLDELDQAALGPAVELSPQLIVGRELPTSAIELGGAPRDNR